MIFNHSDIEAFLVLSGDTNPLHCDHDFARRSGFDMAVVPGMLAALRVVGARKTIRAAFRHPLYGGVEYPFIMDSERNAVSIGNNPKRAMMWFDDAVSVEHWSASDEEHVGEYPVAMPLSWQHLVLCWTSWFVGTQLPGAGAILSNFEAEFSGTTDAVLDNLAYAVRIAQQAHGMVVMDAALRSGDAEAYCEIRAFEARTK